MMTTTHDWNGAAPAATTAAGSGAREQSPRGHLDDRREAVALGGIVVAYLAVCASALWLRSPLGHDESVYALRARDLGDGWSTLSSVYWWDYRAPGLPVMLRLWHPMSDVHVTSSRLLVVMLGGGLIVGTWWLGRLLAGRLVGVIAALLTATSLGFLGATTTLLADVPGAAFVPPAVACYLIELRRGLLRWSFVVVPLLAFVGTAARFGVPFMLASGLVAVSLPMVTPLIRRRDWVLVGQVVVLAVATALVGVLVILTTFLTVNGDTPVEANRRLVDGRELSPAAGWSDLTEVVNPWVDGNLPKLWSPAVASLVGLGIGLAIVRAIDRRNTRGAVVASMLASAASLAAIVISIGQVVSNYLVLTLPYWAILAAIGLAWPAEAVIGRGLVGRYSTLVAGVVIAVGAAVLFVDGARDVRDQHRMYTISFEKIRTVSVQADRAFEECTLVTSYSPQVGYYSRCHAVTWIPEVPEAEPPGTVIDNSSLDQSLERSLAKAHEMFDIDADATGVFVVEQGKRQPPDEQFGTSALLERERLWEIGAEGDRRQHVWIQMVTGR